VAHVGKLLDEGDEQIEFLATAADTGGKLIRCRVTVAPKRPAPPQHSHPGQVEEFNVETGRLGYVLGHASLEAGPGETVTVPAGTNHTFWNAGAGPLVVVSEVRPALRFEDFIETIHVLIRDGKLAAGGGRPNPLMLAVVANAYRREWRLTGLSPVVRVLLPLLAAVGRRAGYREHYSADGQSAANQIATTV
jgi:mannose-6-phosphate isomerase-like protein (cupin superfamily)